MISKKHIAAFVACLTALLFSQAASAVIGSASGTVAYIYTYGDGSVLVTGPYFASGTCSNNGGFYIPATHPNLSRILATVVLAKASGLEVSVAAKTDSCWYPTITTDASTYVTVG